LENRKRYLIVIIIVLVAVVAIAGGGAAGALYPFFGITFRPEFAGLAMVLSSVSVLTLSLLLKGYVPPAKGQTLQTNEFTIQLSIFFMISKFINYICIKLHNNVIRCMEVSL